MKVRYTPEARGDIYDIYRNIARANLEAAQRVEDLIRSKINRLAQFPHTGVRTRLANVRRAPIVKWPYTIFYRIVIAQDSIDILRVVHGKQVKDLGRVPA